MTSLSAQEIQDQLVSLKTDARTRSPGELSRVENVAHEFFQVEILLLKLLLSTQVYVFSAARAPII